MGITAVEDGETEKSNSAGLKFITLEHKIVLLQSIPASLEKSEVFHSFFPVFLIP